MNRNIEVFDKFGRVGTIIRIFYCVSLMFAFSLFIIMFFAQIQTPITKAQEPSTTPDGMLIQNLEDRVKVNESQIQVSAQNEARVADNLDDMKVKVAEMSVQIANVERTLWDLLIPFALMVVKELSDFALWFISRGRPN